MNTELDRILCGIQTGVRIPCHIQPRSSRCKISGIHGDSLKIALTAPPVDGKANAALIEFLSDIFSVPKAKIEIASGLTGRNKSVIVHGMTKNDAVSILEKNLK